MYKLHGNSNIITALSENRQAETRKLEKSNL